MKPSSIFIPLLLLVVIIPTMAQTGEDHRDPVVQAFWAKFQDAVGRDDRKAVAAMTAYPLEMPYGVRKIKSSKEFLKRYAEIFDAATRECFASAEPETEKEGEFIIGCGEAMLYRFAKVNGEYKMVAVDNINE